MDAVMVELGGWQIVGTGRVWRLSRGKGFQPQG